MGGGGRSFRYRMDTTMSCLNPLGSPAAAMTSRRFEIGGGLGKGRKDKVYRGRRHEHDGTTEVKGGVELRLRREHELSMPAAKRCGEAFRPSRGRQTRDFHSSRSSLLPVPSPPCTFLSSYLCGCFSACALDVWRCLPDNLLLSHNTWKPWAGSGQTRPPGGLLLVLSRHTLDPMT